MTKQHPLTDEKKELNSRCKRCLNATFKSHKSGKVNYNIGWCSVKKKQLMSAIPMGKFDCELFKKSY